MRCVTAGAACAALCAALACGTSDTSEPPDPSDTPDAGAPEPSETLGFVFEPVQEEPALAVGACDDPSTSWHCLGHSDPAIVRTADGYRMWFSAGGSLGDFPVVAHARAGADLAFAFDPADQPALMPAVPTPAEKPWDHIRETVAVRYNDEVDRFDMWFLGYATDFFTDGALGHTRSLDAAGTVWEHSAAPIYMRTPGQWDDALVTSPSVVVGPDGVWRLYYTGGSFTAADGRMKVGLLTSTDGVTWAPHGEPVFSGVLGAWDESILDAHVALVGQRYFMWYSAWQGELDFAVTSMSIGVAVSDDGVTWTRARTEPILTPDSDVWWRDLRVLDCDVIVDADGSLLMAAYGSASALVSPDFPEFRMTRVGLWRSR